MSRIRDDLKNREQTRPRAEESGMLRRAVSSGRKLRVAVIGAGMAGIRATDVLLRHGIEVTVFEARNRIGGRVGQSNHLGYLVDLGPNWIHGTNENPILDIARETATKLHSWEERQAGFDQDGRHIPEELLKETSEAFWGIMTDAFQYSNEHSEEIAAERSLLDFVREQAGDKFKDEPSGVAARKRDLIIREAEMWGGFVGSPTRRQSLKFFWLEECLEGENLFVASTYQAILERTALPMKEGAEVRLSTRVDFITHDEEKDHMVQVITASGAEEFDEVVVTLPLGCLKRDKDTFFKPPLPSRLCAAIDSIGYGSLDKVYITFSDAFWEDATSPASAKIAQDGEALEARRSGPNVKATTRPVNQPPGPSTPSNFPASAHWYHPTYSPSTNPECWTQSMLNLAALSHGCSQPTLLFYIFGDCAAHVARLAAIAPPEKRDAALLAFFEPYYSKLPNYSAARTVPTGVLATSWASDELAGCGSYSNFQTGAERADEDIECMRRGVPERRIWLAGEHTSPFVALGTVTGAYWSGEGVARRIVDAYKPESKQ